MARKRKRIAAAAGHAGGNKRGLTLARGEGAITEQWAQDYERDLREKDRRRGEHQRTAAAKGSQANKQQAEDLRAKVNRLTAQVRRKNPTLSRPEIARRIAPACDLSVGYVARLIPKP